MFAGEDIEIAVAIDVADVECVAVDEIAIDEAVTVPGGGVERITIALIHHERSVTIAGSDDHLGILAWLEACSTDAASRVADADRGDAIAVVHQAAIAEFLAGLHARAWETGFDFQSGAAGYAGTLEDLKATLLELLASGAKDEVIARRVGMSERTFRRHVATIMQELSATSRFQAGVLAARTGLVDPVTGSAA